MQTFIHYSTNTDVKEVSSGKQIYHIKKESCKKGRPVFVFGDAANPKKVRVADYIIDPSQRAKKDFIHHKNTGLTLQHIAAMKKHKMAILLPLDHIIRSKDPEKVIARFAAIVKISRKHNILLHYAKDAQCGLLTLSQFRDFRRFLSSF